MFDQELKIFHTQNSELQSAYPSGGFVVIMGEDVLGVWESRIDALKAGLDKYGNVPFLVKNINESDTNINFTRNIAFA